MPLQSAKSVSASSPVAVALRDAANSNVFHGDRAIKFLPYSNNAN